MKYFSLVMSLFYVLAGAMILFTNLFPQISKFRIPLGLILVVYGIIRGIMWRTKQVQSEKEQ
ncbi:MAG: hypothetical protein ABIY71_05330 [Flavobacteriales bacterium]